MTTNEPQYDIEEDEPNTYGRDEITCPFCNYDIGDSWEITSDDGEETCYQCKKSFRWQRIITVEYQSSALSKPKEPTGTTTLKV